jgi:subtilisin family serine protease
MALAIIKPMEFTTQEYLLQVLGPDAEAVFTALENLNKVEWIEWAAPNTASQPKLCGQVIPDDEYFTLQWHWQNTGQSGGVPGADVRAPEAWEITTGDPNIVVAVLDTGVDSNHPDLVNNLVPGYDFIDNDAKPDPSLDHKQNAHGTACAGLVGAQGNNGIGVSGVTWNSKIMPIRLLCMLSNGTWKFATQADIATAFRWAANSGADVLSNSWVWSTSETPIIYSGIIDVTKSGGMGRGGKGCIVLFGAGNDFGPITGYPQKYPEVIAVGGTDHNDIKCDYSNYGPELDIVAPTAWQWTDEDWISSMGKGALWTTDISGLAGWNPDFDPNFLDYTPMNGTSGSCPIAAGVAALILSVEPNLTGDEVRHVLERSANDLGAPGRDDYYGWGRVDARAAIDVIMSDLTDLNNDDQTDFKDFSYLSQYWKQNTSSADLAPIGHRDGKVDVNDLSILAKYWLKHIDIPPLKASNPNPAHITLNVDINADLRWTAGYLASSYDVYFGKTNPPPFVRNQKETTFDPGTMSYSTGYRWRIDSVNSAGTTTGENWSFRTAGPPP